MSLFAFLLICGSGAQALTEVPRVQPPAGGWVIGMDFGAATLSFDLLPMEADLMVGGKLGYRLSKRLTLYAAAYESDFKVRGFPEFDKVTFGHVDFGARIRLPYGGRRWKLYGDLSFSFWSMTDILLDGEQSTTDIVAVPHSDLGGGIEISLSKSWVLDLRFKSGFSTFKDAPLGNVLQAGNGNHSHAYRDINAESSRFSLGIVWSPE
ncbi:MAG: hypothetical protein QGG80_02110 [Candidatus Krumholzibacteria bacterium]|nr:hypothetical protein [Candidatus Krumholzibacteria bacterium]MDP6798152.1 hypothetical protein [Candidatus Krumholzibacteria bacterium]MDP7022001.1 hypothetical protein [Candidatus Krumholzibacteria bacterium]